jgi:2-oxoglutarate dehydrogenase E2 component (dihydrolipoamide succinyltransferase)
MIVDVVMPKMGESIMEGTIIEWRKKIGDVVELDEILLEIGTDKVDSEIPSPTAGTIVEILAEPNDVVAVGTVIARVETKADAASVVSKEEKKSSTPVPEPEPVESTPVKKPVVKTERGTSGKKFFTPVVKKIAAESKIDLTELMTIPGTGRGGRITKQDLLAYLEVRSVTPAAEAVPAPVTFVGEEERVEMTHMRKLIAEHMRASLDTAAHVYVITEVDMTTIVDYVNHHGKSFQEREGFKLTYTPFIVQATVKALTTYPDVNASLEGTTIIRKKHINIGLAVALEKGLMVPVIRNCEELNFLGLCRKVHDLALRTRQNQISPDELQGSTFSITNFGVFNVTMGTPIINQPNAAILGVGVVKKRPVVIETSKGDAIRIKSIMFLSLGFDHGLIDGAGGSRFLASVAENLESMNLESLF